MTNPFDEFDVASEQANPFDEFDQEKKPGFFENVYQGAKGTGAAVLDIAAGVPKVAARTALAVGGKLAEPSTSLQETWERAGEAIEETYPALGKEMRANIGYTAPMKPFELYGQGAEWLAEQASLGNKDAQGALNIIANFTPIPLVGKGARVIKRGIEAVDPGLRAITPESVRGRLTKAHEVLQQAKEEAIVKPKEAKPLEDLKSTESLGGQMNFFDQFDEVQGRPTQFQARPMEAVWRLDEHGIPIRADLSMEAANVEAPLQRNLFGDELGPALGQTRSLTEAVDSVTNNWALRRGLINRLGGRGHVLEAGHDLLAAKMASEGPLIPREPTTRFVPTSPLPTAPLGAYPPDIPTTRDLPSPTAPIKPGIMSVDAAWLAKDKDRFAEPSSTDLASLAEDIAQKGIKEPIIITVSGNRGYVTDGNNRLAAAQLLGIKDIPYKVEMTNVPFTTEQMAKTRDIAELGITPEQMKPKAIGAEAQAANDWLKAFNEGRIDSNGAIVREPSATMASKPLEVLSAVERPLPPDTLATPRSPEKIAEKARLREVASNFPVKSDALREYQPITTKEEALSLAVDAKDITRDFKQRLLAPGLNFMAAMSRNPVLRYAATQLREVRVAVERDSRRFITDKEGVSPLWAKLNTDERIKAWEALQAASDEHLDLTPDLMAKLGLGDKEQVFVTKVREALDYGFELHNKNNQVLGFKPITKLGGYLPGIFRGSYKSLVMDGKKVVGVIATDTIYQCDGAKKYFQEKYPDMTFIDKKRQDLGGNNVRSDLFSGMNDVMNLIAEHDPRFAEIQDAVSSAVKDSNHKLYNFDVHEMKKKGIKGSEGNQPWLNPSENANKGFRALVQFMEDSYQYQHLQIPLKELRDINMSPEVTHLPRTLSYLNEYVKNVTGQGTAPIGQAFNTILDAPFKLIGVGSAVPLKVSGALKNKMSQIYMGFLNYAFTAAQMIQPIQTGAPFMKLVGDRLGNPQTVGKAMFNGNTNSLLMFIEETTGTKMEVAPHMREAFQYAKDRGLSNFSEMERAYEGSKTIFGRGLDRFAEYNMKMGELTTRTPTFMSFVDLLHEGGIPLKDALPIAENLVQISMIDYHQWERPLVYQKLGVVGQFAGGLTTYKHGYMGQQGILAKEAFIGSQEGKRNAKPLIASAAAMLALAGITGTPFYNEFDQLYGSLTDKLGERKSIKESLLTNSPEWLNYGAISAATGIYMQSKFSAADFIPNDLGSALSPQLSGAYKIIADAIDAARNGDSQGVRNLLMSISPSSLKGHMEEAVSKDAQGRLLDRRGNPVIARTEEDWAIRKWAQARPFGEVVERENTFKATQKRLADEAAKRVISEDWKRAFRNGILDKSKQDELIKKYVARKGNPEELINSLPEVAQRLQQTEKQAAEGIPSTYSGAQRYKYYNK